MKCPKCPGTMHSYERNGVHIEQCESCRGIFLDYGELESLTQLEVSMTRPAPPYPAQQPPVWGAQHYPGHGRQRRGGFARMLFSS